MEDDLMESVIVEAPDFQKVLAQVHFQHFDSYLVICGGQPECRKVCFSAKRKTNNQPWNLKIFPFLAVPCGQASVSVVGVDIYECYFVCSWLRRFTKALSDSDNIGVLRKLTEAEKHSCKLLASPMWNFAPWR